MATGINNTKESYSYSKPTITYAEHLCADFVYYQNLYTELLEGPIWAFSSKTINTKINLYRSSDTTAETALKLATSSQRELRQTQLIVESIKKVYNEVCNEEDKKWFLDNLINNCIKKRSLQDKRLRYYFLSHVCHFMGIPEDGRTVKNKMRSVNAHELLRNN